MKVRLRVRVRVRVRVSVRVRFRVGVRVRLGLEGAVAHGGGQAEEGLAFARVDGYLEPEHRQRLGKVVRDLEAWSKCWPNIWLLWQSLTLEAKLRLRWKPPRRHASARASTSRTTWPLGSAGPADRSEAQRAWRWLVMGERPSSRSARSPVNVRTAP